MREPMLKDDVVHTLSPQVPSDDLVRAIKEATEGPGQYLREVREVQGIAAEDLAAQLNLTIKQVAALEDNEFETFPAPIYVRSHLRRYSEYVGLPAEVVVEAYERMGGGNPPPLRRVSIRQQINTRSAAVRLLTYLFATALAILVFAWWQSNGFSLGTSQPTETAAPVQSGPSLNLTLPMQEPADGNAPPQ